MKRMMSIDPGVKSFGYCLWETPRSWQNVRLKFAAVSTFTATEPFEQLEALANFLQEFPFGCDRVVCEIPTFFVGAKGYAAARGGSLVNLSIAVGIVLSWAKQQKAEFVPAPVQSWKGQLSKEATIERIRPQLFTEELQLLTDPPSHDWDAAGIGLWQLGRF